MSEIQKFEGELLTSESGLMAWARDAAEAYKVSQSLAKTSFVSKPFQNNPGEVTAAILTGQEIGLSPMAALRSIDIIQGTPAMRANAMRGLVQGHGHEVWVDESTQTRAVVCGQRKGSDKVQRSVWTIDRASRLGLTGKDNWKKQPEVMLVARATAELCRLIASDVLLGMPYAVEELDETTGEEPKPRKRTAQRKPLPAPVPELEEPQAPTPEPEEPEEPAQGEEQDKGTEQGEVEWPEVIPPGGAQ